VGDAPRTVTVLGATGATGALVVRALLARGHSLRILARRPDAVPTADRAVVIAGDALDAGAVKRALAGADAVVSSLGSRPWRGDRICSEGTRVLVDAMLAHGPKRAIVVSSVGVADTLAHADLATRFARATFLSGVLADKDRMEAIVRASELEWTVVRPVGLTNGALSGRYRAADDGTVRGGFVSRADVAEFIARELDEGKWIRRSPSIGR
jgi:putative NADH-flavin reductase